MTTPLRTLSFVPVPPRPQPTDAILMAALAQRVQEALVIVGGVSEVYPRLSPGPLPRRDQVGVRAGGRPGSEPRAPHDHAFLCCTGRSSRMANRAAWSRDPSNA